MGNDCRRPSTTYTPKKVQLLIRDETFSLPILPVSYESLEQNVELVAKYMYQSSDPLDYYHMSYIHSKTGAQQQLIDEKSFQAALRNWNDKILQVRVDRDSYKCMFALNTCESGSPNLDDSVMALVKHAGIIEEYVVTLLEGYNNLLNFAEKFSAYTKSPSIKVVITTLILVISSSPNAKTAMVFLNSFPYIDFNIDLLEGEALEGAKYWNDFSTCLQRIIPQLPNMKKNFVDVQIGLKQHSMNSELKKNNNFLSEAETLSKALTAGLSFIRKIKNLHKNVVEMVENLAKPEQENAIRSIQNIIEISGAYGAAAALRLFSLRPSVKLSNIK
ncbi:unnamed protein product [Blepharisma stoltei]|uniref:Uncharacterized protein n=1 Tax=Blepharisma stoltei TaxID=1481888 RepID=A0AAU9K649_9CILI|nr:unnamed protein product [Blepharisma stoltei]